MSTTHASGAKNQLTLRQKSVGGDPPAAISFSLELPGHPKLQVLVYLATSALGHFPLNGSTAKNALIPGNFQYLLRIVWYDRYKKI